MTAVVLGGVNIFGGSGSMLGVVLAVVLVAEIRNGMRLDNIGGDTQNIVIGVLLLAAILVGNLLRALQRAASGHASPVRAGKGGAAKGQRRGSQPRGGTRNDRRDGCVRTRCERCCSGLAAVLSAPRQRARRGRRQRSVGGDEPATTAKKASYKIYLIPKFIGIPVFTLTNAGGKEAERARRHGHVQRPDRGRRAEAGAVHRHRGRQGYNAIVISANDPNAVAPALKAAKARAPEGLLRRRRRRTPARST